MVVTKVITTIYLTQDLIDATASSNTNMTRTLLITRLIKAWQANPKIIEGY